MSISETTNSGGPPPEPALISAPTSVVRAVTSPSNGATMRLYCSSTRRRSRLACADRTRPCLLEESAARWSRSCFETAPDVIKDWPRVQRHVGERGIGLGAGEIGFRLHDLLVEVGRVDLGEKLARLDRRADVGLPFLQIAADARIDLRLRIGLEPAGKIERRPLAAGIGQRDGDDRHRLASRSIRRSLASAILRVVMPMTTMTAAMPSAARAAMVSPRRDTTCGGAAGRLGSEPAEWDQAACGSPIAGVPAPRRRW